MRFWPFSSKNKKKDKLSTENLVVSDNFAEILSANSMLSSQFENLTKRFENRVWTPEVCHLFKILAEDLFRHYGLEIEIEPNCSSSGAGSFNVRVLST